MIIQPDFCKFCKFLIRTFSIFAQLADHLRFLRFFASFLFKSKFCSSIKYFLCSLGDKSKSAAMHWVSVSRFSLKYRKFILPIGDNALKFLCLASIFSVKGVLMDAKEGQTNKWCSSFSSFRVKQILQYLDSLSTPECLPFSSSMSKVPPR